jgi:hypothetical protein
VNPASCTKYAEDPLIDAESHLDCRRALYRLWRDSKRAQAENGKITKHPLIFNMDGKQCTAPRLPGDDIRLCLSQSFHRILDAEEDSGLDRAERASCADGKRDRPDEAAAISPGSPVEVLASSRFLAYSRASERNKFGGYRFCCS